MKSKYLIIPFLAILTLCSVSCKDAKKSEQEESYEKASDDLERASKELKAAQKKKFEETGEVDADPERIKRIIEATKEMEKNATGDEAKGARVMRNFVEAIQKDTANLTKYQEGLMKAADYSSIKKAQDIDTLSVHVKTYLKHNEQLTEKIKTGWVDSLKKALIKEGISEKSRNEFMAGFTQSIAPQQPHLLTVRSTDKEICNALLKQHATLKKYFGKWEWDAKQGTPLFQDQAALDEFNAQAINIQKASTRQTEAQRSLINR